MNRMPLVALTGLFLGALLIYLVGSELLGPEEAAEDPYYEGVGEADPEAAAGASLTAHGDGGDAAREAAAAEALKRSADAARRGLVNVSEGVSGVVTDGGGTPIAKARVSLMQAPTVSRRQKGLPPVLAATLTDETGAFVVGPGPVGKRLLLRAEAAGYAPTQVLVQQRGARISMELDRGGRLNVRVLDMDSKPVAGAKVLHAVGSGWDRIVSEGLSGEDGIARFGGVPTGSGNLIVAAAGHAAIQQNNVAVAPGELRDQTIILEDAQQISGTVQAADTKGALEGAVVQVHYPGMVGIVEPSESVSTDRGGQFRILVGVSAGQQYELRVKHEAYAEARVKRNLNLRDEIVIKLMAAGEGLTGDVRGPDGRGAAGVTVTYMGLEGDDLPEATTDSTGRFELAQPPWSVGGVSVLAISPQHGIATRYIRFNSKKALEPIQLRLPGGGDLEGTVFGKNGVGVQGALIKLSVDAKATQQLMGPGQGPWQVINLIRRGSDRVNFSAVSDADGRYLIRGVPAMAYRVSASYETLQARSEEAVLVTAGITSTADITLQTGDTIEGYIVDSDERPVAGALVYAQPVDQRARGWGLSQPRARSQSDGRFVLRGIEDWDYTVSAAAAGYGSSSDKNIRKGTTDLRLTLAKLGRIKGTVMDAGGGPFQGTFRIHVTRAQTGNRSMSRNFWGRNSAEMFNTDDGAFEISGRAAGQYELRASTADGLISLQKETVQVVNGRDTRGVRLQLSMGAVLRGRVTDDATGKPMKNAYVYVNARQGAAGQDQSGATSGNSRTNAKGEYEIKGLGAGAYQVNVWAGGANWSEATDLAAGETKRLNLAKRQPGSVQVIVRDADGRALAGAYPMLRSETGAVANPNWSLMRAEGLFGSGPNAWNEATRTDSGGINVRYHVPPGRYQVTAVLSGHEMDGEGPWVEVLAGSESTAELAMKKKDGS